ncbi:hypothetical protein E4T81_06375 [Barnesiella sp. WM24]|uniref:hypothetical protein n=1 Tax=Barnesiella sp. WM24 TaxID=2558278 RepID=UPI0010716DCF|nr:hypothetical protein [Barnesiella sp. WM24]TFU93579.1 hypothetical protein E4T81_06375 [Barnesiella sp. WM24]
MKKILILFTLLTFSLSGYSNEPISRLNNDSILSKLIKGEQVILHDSLNPCDSLYRVIGSRSYYLDKNKFSGTVIKIIVFPKKGNNIIISLYTVDKYNGYESIYKRELNRVSEWIDMVDITKLIKDKEPCIFNGLAFAKILDVFFIYDIVPKTAEKTTVKNDSIK